MTYKAAYLWGPISSFSGPLAALLLKKGWHVHIATKSALNLFSLAPLDLKSAAQALVEKSLGGHDKLRVFQDRLRLLEAGETARGTTYDAFIFTGLPPNFDEARVPRSPWAASEFAAVSRHLKGVPAFIVSSLWAGVQPDGVVPEELEFSRRKPLSHWEGTCQQYEQRILASLSGLDSPWHLVRLPLIAGSSQDGQSLNFSGLFPLIKALHDKGEQARAGGISGKALELNFNPDATLWFLPVDIAVYFFWRLLEDGSRPRICNLVSTESTLNREWLANLARALGFDGVEVAERDPHAIPGVLRRLLKDTVQVKTRNLFEVAGRYQQPPTKPDEKYFERLVTFATAHNWGNPPPPQAQPIQPEYSEELARIYFEEFLPPHLDEHALAQATSANTTVGFVIEGAEGLTWVLQAKDGLPSVARAAAGGEPARVTLRFSGATFTRLIVNKLSLNRALITREVRIDGPLADAWRVVNVLSRFFKDHPYKAQRAPRQEETPVRA